MTESCDGHATGSCDGHVTAMHGLQDWARAEAAYLEGLTHEPESPMLQQGLADAQARRQGS